MTTVFQVWAHKELSFCIMPSSHKVMFNHAKAPISNFSVMQQQHCTLFPLHIMLISTPIIKVQILFIKKL